MKPCSLQSPLADAASLFAVPASDPLVPTSGEADLAAAFQTARSPSNGRLRERQRPASVCKPQFVRSFKQPTRRMPSVSTNTRKAHPGSHPIQNAPPLAHPRREPILTDPAKPEDVHRWHTVALALVTKKRTANTVRLLVITVLLLVVGLLFLGGLLLIFLLTSYSVVRLAAGIVGMLAVSHLLCVQVKHMARLRHRRFLTSTQWLRAISKKSRAANTQEEMRHLTLSKQDTTGYLQALRARDLTRGD